MAQPARSSFRYLLHALLRDGRAELAAKTSREMEKGGHSVGASIYGAVMEALLQEGMLSRALSVAKRAIEAHTPPRLSVLNALLIACCEGDAYSAEAARPEAALSV